MSLHLTETLLSMAGRGRAFEPGEHLFHRDDPVKWLFIVIYGRVELVRSQPDGNALILQRAGGNTVLAEASLYSDRYHCDGVAALPSRAAAIPKPALLGRLRKEQVLSVLWSSHLAGQMQKARYRSEILSLKTVAERYNAWLNLHDGITPPKGEWKDVAAEIGVSPEAFYRELSKRR